MAVYNNRALNGPTLQSITDPEAYRIVKQCAATLAIIIHDQGIKRVEFVIGILTDSGIDIGDWRISIEKLDNEHMVN